MTDDDSTDDAPFDDLDPDEYRDREGDPFANLAGDGDAGDEATASDESQVSDATSTDDHETNAIGNDPREPDPFEYLGGPESGDSTDADDGNSPSETARSTADRTTADRTTADHNPPESSDSPPSGSSDVEAVDDPLGDVDAGRGDPFESPDNPFERVDVGPADPDAIWAEFTGDVTDADRSDGAETDDATAADATAADATAEDRDETEDVVDVSKHRFCETCPHFSAPPDVECGHQGTAILEFVGTDEVRVSNCPVVGERRELGEVHESR